MHPGYGNCNDIDLAKLLTNFSTITLIDIDIAAVNDGLKRQGCSDVGEINIVELDITGALPWLSEASSQGPPELTELTERCSTPNEIGSFDVVASIGLLSNRWLSRPWIWQYIHRAYARDGLIIGDNPSRVLQTGHIIRAGVFH